MFNHLDACKQMIPGLFKNIFYKHFQIIYKESLEMNYPQVLICHKTQPDQAKLYIFMT